MRATLVVALTAILCLACFSLHATAAHPPRSLCFHHGPGDVANYGYSITGHGTNQEEKHFEFSVAAKCRLKFREEADGLQHAQVRFLSGSVDSTCDGQHESGKVTPMTATLRLSPRDETSSEDVTGQNTEVPFADMSFSIMDVGFRLDLPAEPVKKGSTWKVEQKNRDEGRQPEVVSVTYTYLGEETVKGRLCAKIKASSLAPIAADFPGSEPGQAAHIEGSMANTTVFLFDLARGLVVSAESTDRNEAVMKISGGPAREPSSHKVVQVISSKTVLTEFVPAKPG